MSQYLVTPPALYDDPPADDFAGPQLPVGGGDEPWVDDDEHGCDLHDDLDECKECSECKECGNCFCDEEGYWEDEDDE